uniref:N(6)-L-threonylcarbamoyladenine synthase n=1 Tax=Strigamia maritima TaxID=126957 RepID=T1JHI2_STRMM
MRGSTTRFPYKVKTNWKLSDSCRTVLGIETSCDETGAAIVDSNGKILGECINSQLKIHLAHGGINPLLARDLHKDHIERVVTTALQRSKLTLNDIDAIATTVKPGLELSLRMGLNYTKKIIRECKKPFIPIHHMEAHALTARMVNRIDFPFLVLLISGGHSQIALVKSVSEYLLLGYTLDNAPGEVCDKVARRLKLRNIPKYRFMNGGQAIEKCALSGDPLKFDFTTPLSQYRNCNFSFAGCKTRAESLIIEEEENEEIEADCVISSAADLCASFQHVIAKQIVTRVHRAMMFCERKDLLNGNRKTLVMSGGVACNRYIWGALKILCNHEGFELICPPPELCTDNGIMIAWNGMERLKLGIGVTMDIDSVHVVGKKLTDTHRTVLGIETSCDETAAAVVDSNGNILGECINSQLQTHLAFGGIRPVIASDLHEQNIDKVVTTALNISKLTLNDIDAIATTVKPGLQLSLKVGVNYAKRLIREWKKPFIPIHHMEAHALTARMVNRVDFPFLVLLISGSHCQIAVAKSVSEFLLLGTSVIDAPGEVCDKISRRLKLRNLPQCRFMSGGQAIENLSLSGNALKFKFISPRFKQKDCDFSFRSFKVQAIQTIESEEEKHGIVADGIIPFVSDFCASFQHAITTHIVKKIYRAMIFCEQQHLLNGNNKTLVMSGGVACNRYIWGALKILCDNTDFELICPPPKLCTDNGIMIAWNGLERLKNGIGVTMNVDNIEVEPKCGLGIDIRDRVKNADIKATSDYQLNPDKIRKYAYKTSLDLPSKEIIKR